MSMTQNNDDLGTVEHGNGYYKARLTRFIARDQAQVWAMLTDPDRLVEWLAPGEIELRKGGAAKLNFPESGIVIDSAISEIDPPSLLEYSWSSPGEPARPLRWETAPDAEGTKLTLTLQIPEDEDIARSCAGWEAHLMMLLAAIEGVSIKFPFARFKSTREAYKAIIA
jgi:uncharacterized protein YndB with AHSA1/START domain